MPSQPQLLELLAPSWLFDWQQSRPTKACICRYRKPPQPQMRQTFPLGHRIVFESRGYGTYKLMSIEMMRISLVRSTGDCVIIRTHPKPKNRRNQLDDAIVVSLYYVSLLESMTVNIQVSSRYPRGGGEGEIRCRDGCGILSTMVELSKHVAPFARRIK